MLAKRRLLGFGEIASASPRMHGMSLGPADLAVVLGNWGPAPPNDSIADLNADGIVGPADLAIVLGNWGPCV